MNPPKHVLDTANANLSRLWTVLSVTDGSRAEHKADSKNPKALTDVLGVKPQDVAKRHSAFVTLDYLRAVYGPDGVSWVSRDCGIIVPYLLNDKAVCRHCHRRPGAGGVCDINIAVLHGHGSSKIARSQQQSSSIGAVGGLGQTIASVYTYPCFPNPFLNFEIPGGECQNLQ